jgi:Zn-dependent protease/CBS domain-containing protein
MSWSLKLGRPFGIPLYIHWSFLILIAWLVYTHTASGDDARTTALGIAFVLSIFGCVILHELGHALTARRFGIKTADITMLPIGGVARLERMPDKPQQEFLVAIAGPLVNFAIAGILLAIGVSPRLPANAGDRFADVPFGTKLLDANLFLGLFNLLPAFPMDGGRILRSLLALKLSYPKATRLAASIGQFMAILFGFAGLTGGNPFLVLIALFVWLGAEAEARQVEERFLLADVPLEQAMLTDYHALRPDDTLRHAASLLLAGSQQDFPVLFEGVPTGVLTRAGLVSGLAASGPELPVAQASLAELRRVELGSSLVEALSALRESGSPCLLVVERDRPVGLLTGENVQEYLMVRAALDARGGTPSFAPGPAAS